MPFKFTGNIAKLTFDLDPASHKDREASPVVSDRVAPAKD